MNANTIRIPQEFIVGMLKALPENVLKEIFWKSFADSENAPLCVEERSDLAVADEEFVKGETVRWDDLR
jgi:hypothetical protein